MKYMKKSTICPYKFILLLFPGITKVKAIQISLHSFDISSKSRNSIVSQFETHKQRSHSFVPSKKKLTSECSIPHAFSIIGSLSSLELHNKSPLEFTHWQSWPYYPYMVSRLLSLMPICWDGVVAACKLTQGVRCGGKVDRQLVQHDSFNLRYRNSFFTKEQWSISTTRLAIEQTVRFRSRESTQEHWLRSDHTLVTGMSHSHRKLTQIILLYRECRTSLYVIGGGTRHEQPPETDHTQNWANQLFV